jgi:serine/threonine protein kinase
MMVTRSGDRDEAQMRVGPYRVIRCIGRGGMASVFEAEDERLGQRVALKQLHPHVAEREGAAERFLREGRAAARVRHPHVVQVFALGGEAETPYLAMELLEGEDLAAILAREKYLSVERALDLLLPVMAAVAAAHDVGVIHRDLKPSNVFVATGPGGRAFPKVVDFGVSKLLVNPDAKDLTASETVVGTAAYMAPEQARAVRNASFRSDQYALGVMLYECVTGERPFTGGSFYEILQAIMTAPLAPPSQVAQRAHGVPAAIDAPIVRALSRAAEERFPSVRALGAALLPFASEAARAAWSDELSRPAPLETSCTPVSMVRESEAVTSALLLTRTARGTGVTARPRRRMALFALTGGLGLVLAVMLAREPAHANHTDAAVPMVPARIASAASAPAPSSHMLQSVAPIMMRDTAMAHATSAPASAQAKGLARPARGSGEARPGRPSLAVAFPASSAEARESAAAPHVPLGGNDAPILP